MSRERDRNDRDKRLKKEPSTLWQKAKETITGRRSRSNSLVSSKREAQDTGVRESSASGISASSGGGGGGGGVGGGGHVGGHIARSPSTISLAQIQSQMTSPSTSILTVTSPPPKEGVSHIPPVSPMDMEKYHNPKLISFPGIVKLEEERRTRIRNLSVSGGVPEVNTGAGGWTGGGTVPSTRRNSPEPHRGLVHQASDSKLLARYQASGASNTSGFHTSSSSNTLRAHARQEPPSPGQEYFDRPVTPSSSSKLPTTLVEAKKWITQHTQRSTKNRVNGTTNGNDVGTAKANGHPPRGSSLSDLLARKDLDSGTEKEDLSRSASHSGYTYKATVPSKGSLKVRQERERVEAPTPDPSRDPFSGPLFGQVPRGVSPYANGSAAVHREKPEIKPWDDTNNNASPGNSPTDVVFGFPSSTSTILSGFATSSSVLLTSPADSIPSSSTASAIPVSTPTTPSDSSTSTSRGGASPSSQEVLQRLDALLNSSPIDPNLSNFLDEPPRILLFSTAIKMVHSPTEVKNRYLFIFNDILVIAKANEDEAGRHWTERSFSVKNILELGKIQMEIPPDPRVMSDFSQLPVVKQFSRDFHYSPDEAIVQFLETTGMKHDPSVIGSLLFEVVSLSKTKLGQYLSKRSSKPVLKAFVDKFAFAGVRIDEALRAFLLAMRLPTESSHDMEHLLIMFSSRWYEANKGAVLYEKDFAIRFVFAMMQLNDALHSESHSQSTVAIGLFSFPNLAITPHDFIQALRSRDSSHALSDNTLDEIYRSIADEELLQAAIGKTVPLFITPSLPERLTMLAPSLFTIQIPSIDPYFRIDLIGQDLTFEPKTLEFSSSNEATFQVTGSTTGQKTMLFVRKGFNAPLYTGLPLSKEFAVVRSFMQDTFIINFRNNENVKKKHMVHVPDPIAYNNCCRLLREYIDTARAELPSSSSSPSASSIPHQLKRAAQAVAVQVLRDSLIVHDEPSKGVLLPALSGKNFPLSPSFAVLAQQARGDPNYPYRNPRSHSPSGPSEIQRSRALSGLDLTLACRQNSLIPFILTFMQVIKPPDVDPVGMGGIDDESRKWRGIRI
jgi:serine/arginine repetitive matrix protein 2